MVYATAPRRSLQALSAAGNPTWSTILKVTGALGLRLELHPVA
jgi:DNA-binding phage protein